MEPRQPGQEPERVERTPSTGTADPSRTEIQREQEPQLSGTLFLTVILLMLIFGFWMMMYIEMINR